MHNLKLINHSMNFNPSTALWEEYVGIEWALHEPQGAISTLGEVSLGREQLGSGGQLVLMGCQKRLSHLVWSNHLLADTTSLASLGLFFPSSRYLGHSGPDMLWPS